MNMERKESWRLPLEYKFFNRIVDHILEHKLRMWIICFFSFKKGFPYTS